MTAKKESPTGRKVRLEKGGADDLDARLQYNHLPRFEQYQNSLEQYRRAFRRMMTDAFVTLRQFPARLRFSYYVDRNGKLRPLSERRAAG